MADALTFTQLVSLAMHLRVRGRRHSDARHEWDALSDEDRAWWIKETRALLKEAQVSVQ